MAAVCAPELDSLTLSRLGSRLVVILQYFTTDLRTIVCAHWGCWPSSNRWPRTIAGVIGSLGGLWTPAHCNGVLVYFVEY